MESRARPTAVWGGSGSGKAAHSNGVLDGIAQGYRSGIFPCRSPGVVVRVNTSDEGLDAPHMGAAPVNAIAARTSAERIVVPLCQRLQPVRYGGLVDVLESAVAARAARKRVGGTAEIESADYFGELVARVVGPHEVAMGHDPPLEDIAVAREQYAIVRGRQRRELAVVDVVAVMGVEAAEAEVAGERAQVGIQRKPDPVTRSSTRKVTGILDRVDINAVTVADDVPEIHRLAVDREPTDLGMGYAERLDHILDRGAPIEGMRKRDPLPFRGQEVVECVVESELGFGHGRSGGCAWDWSEASAPSGA